MKQKFSILFTAVITAILLIFIPSNNVDVSANSAQVDVEIKEAGSNNTSIANEYFANKATYTVENGKNYVQMTITDAQFVKSLSGPYGAAQVISDSGDTRVVKLQVGDLSQPVNLSMHVVVPEEIAGMEYDNHHTARAVFSNVPNLDSQEPTNSEESTAGDTVENPQTGDSTPIAMYIALIVAAVGVFVVYRLRVARTE